MKKRVIVTKVVVFLVLLAILVAGLNQILLRKELLPPWDMTHKVAGFYNEPDHSTDVMFFGSSHSYCSFNPLVLWEEQGISSYNFATQKQPYWISYYYMKEAFQTQSPKVVVLELYGANTMDEFADTATNHAAIDSLRPSFNKWQLIGTAVDPSQWLDYLLPLISYHSRWDTVGKSDLDIRYFWRQDYLHGFVHIDKTTDIDRPGAEGEVSGEGPVLDKSMVYLQKIVDLVEEQGAQLVLVGAPCQASEELLQKFNRIKRFAEENQIPYLDYNGKMEEVGLDRFADFCEPDHLNYLGAQKVTSHFGDWLRANFDLPDHRGEEAYSGWDEDLARYQAGLAK